MTTLKSIPLLLIFPIVFFINDSVLAQEQPLQLTSAQAIEDFNWLRFSLEYVHPRLYKYDSKIAVDARFDSVRAQVNNGISGLDFLALVRQVNASVRCGHLYTIPQGQLEKEVLSKKVLPFQIKVLEDSIYVLHDCSNASIRNGSSILSINGVQSKKILTSILPGIASDGYIQTRKLRLMERYIYYPFQGFDLYYHLHVDRSDVFKIEYLEYGTGKKKSVTIPGISIEERSKLLLKKYRIDSQAWFKTPSPSLAINEQKNYALLTVSRSFYNKAIDPDFSSFLDSTFYALKSKKIDNLIIDLRNNEGGSEQQQMELMSYLYDQPFRLYQHIYLSHLDFRPLRQVIIERDTSNLLFNNDDSYMRKINDHLWINNYEYSDNLMLKPPKANVFKGKLYVLMNGTCFSSAADLVADLKKTTTAVFIGEETGGTYEGPTGGDAIVIQLPNSKIMVRISPNIQLGYMYQIHPVGRGVLPTHPIKYTIKDVVENVDLEMELAKALIQKSK
ncbi:hypothetical protein HB364_21520 [Pseudoflavitalea sp. X16]|uniref:S41 family peptidase n=1 Tax=Paraflavitalea devenefica TaxID=2716334 RepID=UPI001421A0B4|nr:S41 family peptidase [Paraflavitalea devenefica]NII27677.1 hypothetical protein [Paraflavitalea devenefica]